MSLLCSACRPIFCGMPRSIPAPDDGSYPPEQQRQTHHVSPESLLTALELGCHICVRLYAKISGGDSDENKILAPRRTRLRAAEQEQGSRRCTTWALLQPREDGDALALVIVADESSFTGLACLSCTFVLLSIDAFDSARHLQHCAATASNTSCDVAWSLACSWIAECSASHKSCGPQNPKFVPTRLLQIGTDAAEPIRLVIAAEEEKRGSPITRYASLSHCWGGADVPTLTSQTIAGLRQGISPDALPRTFAEVVAVVRRLGIKHLWIDSLCIVQDSAADWASEAGIMGEVYANSTLNIMATASRDSHGGLYRDRDPEMMLRLARVETTWTHNGMTTEMGATKDYFLADRDLWQDSVAEAPLNTRGWVLQERVLSSRALHFGSHQLLWECRDLSACETYPAGLPEVLLGDVDRIKPINPKAFPALSIPRSAAVLPSASHASSMTLDDQAIVEQGREAVAKQLQQAKLAAELFELASLWSNWVQAYSAAKLTRRSDKMIAISGLAKMMRTLRGGNGDRYLAGLWRAGLVDQLLWYAVSPAPRTGMRGGPAATSSRMATGIPSWSWMSIDVEVVPGFPTTQQDGIKRHIQVLGASTTPASASDETGPLLGGELRIKGSLMQATLSTMSTLTVNGTGKLDVDFHLDEEEGNARRTEVVLMPVMTDGDDEVSLLCLRREDARPQGWYSRLGHLTARAEVVRRAGSGSGGRDHLYLQGQVPVLVII